MMRAFVLALACAALTACAPLPAQAQADSTAHPGAIYDGEVTWKGYGAAPQRSARVRVFASEDARRPHTIVVDDRAGNGRAPITQEARYVAETIGRELGYDPTEAAFVFRFTEGSFTEGGSDRGRTLLIKATFGRTGSGALAAPSWRVLTPEGLEDLTDRMMR